MPGPDPAARRPWRGVIEEYRASLPVDAATPVITLGEGGTPLLPAPAVSELTGCEVYLKVEGVNPTGSFKDRGMTVSVSLAAQRGATTVICASTGNTSASAAAYAARAGLDCAVLVPRGKIALGKLAQALVYGARLLEVDGNFDDCLELVRKLATDYPVALVNSVNTDRLHGQKTA
ncbi:MAG: threonine synthase, partial [Oryzihumus sp.]